MNNLLELRPKLTGSERLRRLVAAIAATSRWSRCDSSDSIDLSLRLQRLERLQQTVAFVAAIAATSRWDRSATIYSVNQNDWQISNILHAVFKISKQKIYWLQIFCTNRDFAQIEILHKSSFNRSIGRSVGRSVGQILNSQNNKLISPMHKKMN